jgi:hypothetical protein
VTRTNASRCGTNGGYRKHLELGEPTCQDCRDAHMVYKKQWRTARERDAQKRAEALAQPRPPSPVGRNRRDYSDTVWAFDIQAAIERAAAATYHPVNRVKVA